MSTLNILIYLVHDKFTELAFNLILETYFYEEPFADD